MSTTMVLCDICQTRPARYSCKLCGRRVCEEHYDSKVGICVSCKRGRILGKRHPQSK